MVDDGFDPDHDEILAPTCTHGATIHHCPKNRGKSHTLKIGFAITRQRHPGEAVICAGSDGQREVPGIARVAREIGTGSRETVLRGHRFTGRILLCDASGSKVTGWLFKILIVIRMDDTQTGLRAYPPSLLKWPGTVPRERFGYKLSLLPQIGEAGISTREVEIEAIHLHDDESSHFRPIRGS